MKKLIFAGIMSALCGSAVSADAAHWSYSGEDGPEAWAKLTPGNFACAGKNQSPVDLKGSIRADLKPLKLDYAAGGSEVLNNGHTLQVGYAPGSALWLDSVRFELKQLHFHAPSEHLIDGQSFPLEAHLVHADADGNLTVVAVMFNEGPENRALAPIWTRLPAQAGEKYSLPVPMAATTLLPTNRAYYRFSGSLTTPPCTEGVRWLVMKQPVSVSKEQLEAFSYVVRHPNNRPPQPLNGRAILN